MAASEQQEPPFAFKKYPNIENTTVERMMSVAREQFADEEWVVTEKIHGANFSLHTDGTCVRAARRTAFLDAGDPFFAWDDVLARHADAMRQLHATLGASGVVTVYGELYGGHYQGVDATNAGSRKASAIFKEVQYSPSVQFAAFDVRVGDAFLDYIEAAMALAAVDIPYVPIAFTGTLREALAYSDASYNHPSLIHAQLHGLPPPRAPQVVIPNIREGNVIKPLADRRMRGKYATRIIFKHKNALFDEKRGQGGLSKKKADAEDVVLDDAEQAVADSLAARVTAARISNVYSAIGNTPVARRLCGAVQSDIIKEFRREADHPSVNLRKLRHYAAINTQLAALVKQCVDEWLEARAE